MHARTFLDQDGGDLNVLDIVDAAQVVEEARHLQQIHRRQAAVMRMSARKHGGSRGSKNGGVSAREKKMS